MQGAQRGLKQKTKINLNFSTKKYFFPVKDCRCPDAWTGFFCTGFWLVVCEERSDADGWDSADIAGQLKSNNSWYWWDSMHLSGHLTKRKRAVCGPWRMLPPFWVAINPLINQKYLKLWLIGVNFKSYQEKYHEIVLMISPTSERPPAADSIFDFYTDDMRWIPMALKRPNW